MRLSHLVLGLCVLVLFFSESLLPARVENHCKIVIWKADRKLELYKGNQLVKTYRICLGWNPLGAKQMTQDGKTPEGDYFICYKTEASKFYRFLGISYPDANDAVRALDTGMISRAVKNSIDGFRIGNDPPWDTALGGWVGIHGYPTKWYDKMWTVLLYPKPHDWTNGCIALWDFEIEELFSKVNVGTPISILP
jgi:murein L,D-transpeptidase YafK